MFRGLGHLPGNDKIRVLDGSGAPGLDFLLKDGSYVEMKHWTDVDASSSWTTERLEAQLASHAKRFPNGKIVKYVFRGEKDDVWVTALKDVAKRKDIILSIEFLNLLTILPNP